MFETAKLIIEYNKNSEDVGIRTIINGLKLGIELQNKHIVKKFVNQYNEYLDKIWKDEVTDPKSYNSGEPFKFIVHNLTKDDFYDEYKTELVSASLITNKSMCVCGKNKIGFVLAPYNIKAAVPYDLFTINDYFEPSFHLEDYNNREYNEAFSTASTILTPNVIEREIIKQTVDKNGELLNNDKAKIFSEIVIDGWCPTAIYTITNGEKEISRDYRRAQNLNKRYMFNYLDIDKSIYRIQNNLEPLTNGEQIELMENLFELTGTSIEQLEQLRERVIRLFLDLKEKNIYSSDLFIKEFQKIKK